MIAKGFTAGEATLCIEPVRSGERNPSLQFQLCEPRCFGKYLGMGDELIGSTLPSGFRSDVEFLQFRERAAQEQRTASDGAPLGPSHEYMDPIGQKRLNRDWDLPFGGK